MNRDFVHKSVITLLIGAGPTSKEMILSSAVYASSFVAADGGFNAATDAGLDVALVVGDMDSQSKPFGSQNFLEMKEQDTTDFEKCRDPTIWNLGSYSLGSCSLGSRPLLQSEVPIQWH